MPARRAARRLRVARAARGATPVGATRGTGRQASLPRPSRVLVPGARNPSPNLPRSKLIFATAVASGMTTSERAPDTRRRSSARSKVRRSARNGAGPSSAGSGTDMGIGTWDPEPQARDRGVSGGRADLEVHFSPSEPPRRDAARRTPGASLPTGGAAVSPVDSTWTRLAVHKARWPAREISSWLTSPPGATASTASSSKGPDEHRQTTEQ